MKSIYESIGRGYTQQGDYVIPNIEIEDKAESPMEWVQKMNNIRGRATEIVNTEVIFV